jgi:hypothetical protein
VPKSVFSGSGHAVGGHRTRKSTSGLSINTCFHARVGLVRAYSNQPGGYTMNRLNILRLSAITALGFAVLPGSAVAQQKTLKEQLVGTWSLVSVETAAKDGTKVPFVEGSNIKGIQIFTSKHFSFQVIADFPKLASGNRLNTTPEENKAVAHGVQSYFGTYTVNEAEKSWTTHTERGSQPNQNGTETKRTIASITSTELRYSTPLASGSTNYFVWKREE